MKRRTLPESITLRKVTMDDLDAVVALINRCSTELLGEAPLKGGEVRAEWKSPGRDLTRNMRAAVAPDGSLVGYVEVWDRAPSVRAHVFGRVHPDFRGLGIGTALCQWAEKRARQVTAKAPPEARVVMTQEVLSTDEAARQLLEDQDYVRVRSSFYMVIEMDELPPVPVVPEGIIIEFRRWKPPA